MRFVFISAMAGVPWGGSEELWSRTALRLHQEGHEVSASVVWWPQIPSEVARLAEQGVKVVSQARPYERWPVVVWRKIKRRIGTERPEVSWLRRKRPDLVIISQGHNRDGLEWMNICRETEVPYAVIVHCNSECWWPTDETGGEMALAYRAARRVFCVSRHNLELLQRQIGESLPNAGVVWNPCNVSTEQPPPWPKENGVWKLACVARIEPAAKGQDLLLQVLSRTQWLECPLEVNFYGAGAGEQSLKRLADRCHVSNVRFRGHAADVRKIWEDNHLLVLPSRYEGLPLALVEAMWCSRAALVTDVGGNAELCKDGETGFVAEAPAVGLLERTLERAWNRRQDWQSMGKLARARVEQAIPRDPVGEFCRRLTEAIED